ncbi:MAG: hypothetical protein ABIP90_08630, partial [Vicinamibacterales bacterium]
AGRLLRTLGHYFFRPAESIASIFDRPARSLQRWDELSKRKNVVALAAVDAHARIGIDESAEAGPSSPMVARPTYKDMFGTVSQAVNVPEPMTGEAPRDAAAILGALRSGRTYSVVRAMASPGTVAFSATDGAQTAHMGEALESSSPVTISASVPAPADAALVVFRDGEQVATGIGSVTYETTGPPAAYRAEVRLTGASVPWIVTNVIRIGRALAVATASPGVPVMIRRLEDPTTWVAEQHTSSLSEVRADGGEVAMTFRLAPGPLNGQFAAMSYPLPGQEMFESVTATLHANAPMRVSVQVRQPGGDDGERWHRSIYIDETPREVTLRLNDFRLGEVVTDRKPTPTLVRSLLFVVDTWHTKPGTAGTVWVSGVTLGGGVPMTSLKSAR